MDRTEREHCVGDVGAQVLAWLSSEAGKGPLACEKLQDLISVLQEKKGSELHALTMGMIRPVRHRTKGDHLLEFGPFDDVSVSLVAWSPLLLSSAHDHGLSAGAVQVLRGRLKEYVFMPSSPDDLNAGECVKVATKEKLSVPGDVSCFPEGHIHAMGNPHEAVAVSLHAYMPVLKERIYAVRGETIQQLRRASSL